MGRAQDWPTQRLFETAVIADPHLVVAQGVARLLSAVMGSVKVVGSGEELIESARHAPPDVVISEIKLPGISGLDTMAFLRSQDVRTPFVFLTENTKASMGLRATEAGAHAYLPKTVTVNELLLALEKVAGGGFYVAQEMNSRMAKEKRLGPGGLTPMELRVLQNIFDGWGTKESAALLGISVRTVETHKSIMMQKLGVHSTLNLVRWAKAEGLVGD